MRVRELAGPWRRRRGDGNHQNGTGWDGAGRRDGTIWVGREDGG